MNREILIGFVSACAACLVGCHSTPVAVGPTDAGTVAPTMSSIRHLVIVVQENHSFDSYFGTWCQAATGTNPTCNHGPGCCEAAPPTEPRGAKPIDLTDAENASYDPDHTQGCELAEIDGGKMDDYVQGPTCASTHNFAYASAPVIQPYWDLASKFAIADRYFQPVAGQSSSNDMYLARAAFVFLDNAYAPPGAIAGNCGFPNPDKMTFPGPTIGDLLADANVSWAFYAQGYGAAVTAHDQTPPGCAEADDNCSLSLDTYPCIYDPTDVPFNYYARFMDNPTYLRDFGQFGADIKAGSLPSVSWVKGFGYNTEHPGLGTKISDGTTFVTSVVNAVLSSEFYGSDTLVLVTYDESGGYFDHIPPPPPSTVDNQPYGARIPLFAIGPFAQKGGYVSHVMMEHSSTVKFIEWNWLNGVTGQLNTRDAVVNNIGSVLDPTMTGVPVPE